MKSNFTKSIFLILTCIATVIIGVVKKTGNYFESVIIGVLIFQGINAIYDFALDLPMNVGYAKTLYPTDDNRIGRIILLIVAIALMILAVYWIIIGQF